MKKGIIFLTAVLLFGVLLFFWEGKGKFGSSKEKTKAPVSEKKGPETLYNVWILSSEKDKIRFFFQGEEKTLHTKGEVPEVLEEVVADMVVEEDIITALTVKQDKISGKVLRADEKGIELEGYGELLFSEHWTLYRMYDTVASESSEKLLVGSEGNEFVLENGKVCAALITEAPNMKNIRVLIGTEGFRGYYHDAVKVTSDTDYTVHVGEKEIKYSAGEVCTFERKDFEDGSERRVIVSNEEEGKITLLHLKRSGNHPGYRGRLEIDCAKEGLLLVNELPLEEYLYAVLPSEMPSDFAGEALKAQAICARSYAYTELMANRYAEYGAHVDDSVSSQVYNNIPESEACVLAVKGTHGQIVMYEGKPAQCYYFSTSCGHTTSAADVWENAQARTYLPGKLHVADSENKEEESFFEDTGEIAEKEMKLFLEDSKIKTYDSESPWYRWEVFLPEQRLEETIASALKKRFKEVPEQILTYNKATGAFEEKPIEGIGELKKLQVQKRGIGGIVTELLIEGSEGVFLVKNEYNIRTVLAPLESVIYRKNGEKVSGSSLLPSAFLTLQKGIYREETGYLIRGGGYGHGVGMSQYGADAMARMGYDCEEIIEEYYPGTSLGFIYRN